jgi:putative transposase
MARPLRIEYPDAFYHVTARGNERKDIFKDDKDRERFLGYLETAVARYKAVIHVYCLMGNHYHLLLSAPSGNLSQILRHINGAYANFFNKRHQRAGHLFQGRYRAILIEADEYAGEFSRYIHLNPVRAGIVQRPENYPWSSFTAYTGDKKPPAWLTTEWLLGYFGKGKETHQRAYKAFVEATLGLAEDDPLEKAVGSAVLGSADFLQQIRDRYLGHASRDRNLPALKLLTRHSLEDIITAVEKEFRDNAALRKRASLYLAHRYSGLPLKEIAEPFAVGESAVSQASRRFEEAVASDKTLRKRIYRQCKALNLSYV